MKHNIVLIVKLRVNLIKPNENQLNQGDVNQGDGDSDTFSLIAGYGVFVERRTGFGIFAAFPVQQGDFPESDREKSSLF